MVKPAMYATMLSRLLLILTAVLVLTACASARYEQDYHPDTHFGDYQTYVWRSGDAQIPGVEMARLQRMAQEALEEHGLIMDPEAPDLLLSLHAFTRRATGGSRGVGLSIGVPIGRSGTLGVGGSRALSPAERQEGVLVLDITERRSNELIWRGTASGIPLDHFKLAQEQQLRRVLDRLTQQFPPE
jgi:hypothetical protein